MTVVTLLTVVIVLRVLEVVIEALLPPEVVPEPVIPLVVPPVEGVLTPPEGVVELEVTRVVLPTVPVRDGAELDPEPVAEVVVVDALPVLRWKQVHALLMAGVANELTKAGNVTPGVAR